MFKKIIILNILILLVFVFVGCKSKKIQPQNTETEQNQNNTLNTGSVVIGGNLPNNSSNNKNTSNNNNTQNNTKSVKDQIQNKDSVLKLPGDYRNVDFIDVNDWTPYVNYELGLSFFYPNGYVIVQEVPGRFLLTGEGMPDFYTLTVGPELAVVEDGVLFNKPNNITLNGNDYVIEEYKFQYGVTVISYVKQYKDNWYRFSFSYFEGYEDMLDLFNVAMSTVEFI